VLISVHEPCEVFRSVSDVVISIDRKCNERGNECEHLMDGCQEITNEILNKRVM
jgi:hypothetical protein